MLWRMTVVQRFALVRELVPRPTGDSPSLREIRLHPLSKLVGNGLSYGFRVSQGGVRPWRMLH